MRTFFTLAVLLLFTGCPKAEPPPFDPSQVQLLVDGKPVWPPSGEGCEALVACCGAMGAAESSVHLMCQLAAANGGTCAEMKTLATSYFREKGQTPPAVCD